MGDKSGDGTLDIKELLPLLTAVGRAPKNLIEQQELTRALQDYVQKPDPEEGGNGEDDEEEEEQQGEIDFLGFLQLMRRFLDDSDAQMLRKEEEAIARTGFSPDEVTLWRDIFVKFDADHSGEYDTSEGKKLLSAIGIVIHDRSMNVKYFALFKEADEDQSGGVDFAEFLLLMKKLIDCDFGGIAAMAQGGSTANKKRKSTQRSDDMGSKAKDLKNTVCKPPHRPVLPLEPGQMPPPGRRQSKDRSAPKKKK